MCPAIHLSWVAGRLADPEAYVLVRTVLLYREQHVPSRHTPILETLAQGPPDGARPGPSSVLLGRLRSIGWVWQGHGVWLDHDQLPCSLLQCRVQEARDRLISGWQHAATAYVVKRRSFAGLLQAHASLTTEVLHKLPPDHQGVLIAALNGTWYTNDKGAADSNKDCRFCGQPDSALHRHWLCPHFEAQRARCPSQVRCQILASPPVCGAHGWVPTPNSLREFRAALLMLPTLEAAFESQPNLPSELALFTDGGCLEPSCAYSRVSYWGVSIASDEDPWVFRPLSAGLVPGWQQSAMRAELYAVLSALTFIASVQRPARLWIDNQRALSGLLALINNEVTVPVNRKNADIWQSIHDIVPTCRSLVLGVHKVTSHQGPEGLTNPYERWAATGNSAVDRLAESAVSAHPQILQLHLRLKAGLRAVRELRYHVHDVIIRVGLAAAPAQRSQGPTEHDPPRIDPNCVPAQVTTLSIAMPRGQRFVGLLFPGAQRFLAWMASLNGVQCEAVYVSWPQLFMDLAADLLSQGPLTKQVVPWRDVKQKAWRPPEAWPGPCQPFGQQVRSLSRYVKALLAAACMQCTTLLGRASAHSLLWWQQVLYLRVPADRMRRVDDLLCREGPLFQSLAELEAAWS